MSRPQFHRWLVAAAILAAANGCYAPASRLDEFSRSNSLPLLMPVTPDRQDSQVDSKTGNRVATASGTRPTGRETGKVIPASANEPAAPAGAVADPASPLTLDQLEQLAQANNPILQRDIAKLESARGQALQAGLYPNPHFDTNNPEVFAGRNSTYNVGFQQEIVVKGKLKLDTAAANQSIRQAELTFQQNRLDLLTNVRKQYFAVLVDRRRVQVLTELSAIVKAAATTGKALEKAGETNKIDTLLLIVDSEKVQADLRRAQTLLVGDQKQLAAVVGVPWVETAQLAGSLALRPPDFDEEVIRRYAVSASTIIEYAKANITRNRILLQRAMVEPYPNVTVGPAYQFGVTPGNDQFWLTVTFPIPVWDRNQGNVRSALANIRDAEQTLKALQNDQLQKVADALSRYLAARQQVDSYEKSILPTLIQAQKLAQEGYAKGVFEFARYIQAQRTVVETNLSYVDALNDLWTAASDLAGILQMERLP